MSARDASDRWSAEERVPLPQGLIVGSQIEHELHGTSLVCVPAFSKL